MHLDGGSGVAVEIHPAHITQIGMKGAIYFKKFRLGPVDLHTWRSEIFLVKENETTTFSQSETRYILQLPSGTESGGC